MTRPKHTRRARVRSWISSRPAKAPIAYALATDDIAAEAEGLRAAGRPVIGWLAMERLRPDGTKLSWRLVIPGDGS
jgi:hypothetical protein